MMKANLIGILAVLLVVCTMATVRAEPPAVNEDGDGVAAGWGELMRRGAGEEAPGEKPETKKLSVDELLEMFDANDNGKLDGDEITKARSEARRRRMAEARERVGNGQGDQEKPWQEFDTDGNGKLDRAEAMKMRETMKQRKEAEAAKAGAGQAAGGQGKPQNMEQMVQQFDADGDGRLSPQEMMQARQKMIMQKCDVDGDGQLNKMEMMRAQQMMQRYAGGDCPDGGCEMGQGPRGPQMGGQGQGGMGRGMGPQGGMGGGRGGEMGGGRGGGGRGGR